jgi:hypothetical protein
MIDEKRHVVFKLNYATKLIFFSLLGFIKMEPLK